MADTTTCSTCHRPIPDDAERWPHDDGVVCQECWEDAAAEAWWKVAQAIEAEREEA